MNAAIEEQLCEIETKEDVVILHAVESGSRAWGFASPDSDYDVRFIYVRSPALYMRLDKTRDVVEWMLDDTLDINGWDLRKALRLLHGSNATLFEWCNSPIVYRTNPAFAKLKRTMNAYFSCKSGLYQYIHTAKTNYRAYLKGDTVRLKKYLYVLRPMLACRWILERRCPPPMLFSELVRTQLEPELVPVVEDLLERKMKAPEVAEGRRVDALNAFIEEHIPALMLQIGAAPKEARRDWAPLNALFLSCLGACYGETVRDER